MEQQLRAGITPTLPTSSESRDNLARSLSLSEDNKASAAAIPSSLPMVMERPSSVKSTPSSNKLTKVSKKRGRPFRGEENRAVVVASSGGKVWAVVKEWRFAKGCGEKHDVKMPPFFKELWMMMAAFGKSPESIRLG